MEFDTNSPVSDEQRRLAETKRITLQPVHADIAPEPIPDAEIAANYDNSPAVANIDIDTEQNAELIQPSRGLRSTAAATSGRRHTAAKVITAVSVVTLACIAIATALIVQK